MISEINQKLEKYLTDVLSNEIIIAQKSYYILQTMNIHWDKISINGYDLFFKSSYSAHFIRYSIAITKLFERSSKDFDTISIPYVINFIQKNIDQFSIKNRNYLIQQFSQLGYSDKMLNTLSIEDLKVKMINDFKDQFTSTNNVLDLNLSQTFNIIKTYRDKCYVHNEEVVFSTMPKMTHEEANKLLLFAKQFVNIFSIAFLNIVQYYVGKEYWFDRVAIRTNISFKRLLEKAILIPCQTFEE